eukprot:6197033-Pleurochrysis_carterae.AAC.1
MEQLFLRARRLARGYRAIFATVLNSAALDTLSFINTTVFAIAVPIRRTLCHGLWILLLQLASGPQTISFRYSHSCMPCNIAGLYTTAHSCQCLTPCQCQVPRACPAAFPWTRRLGRLGGRLASPGLRSGLPAGCNAVAASPQALCHAGQRPSSGQPASLSSR